MGIIRFHGEPPDDPIGGNDNLSQSSFRDATDLFELGGGQRDAGWSEAADGRHLGKLCPGADVVVVTDDDALNLWLGERGFRALRWTPDLAVAKGSLVVLVVCHLIPSRSVREQFQEVSVLLVPISAFDDSPDAIIYTMELVLRTDFEASLRRNEAWVELLRNKPDGCLHFKGPGTDLRCAIGEDIQVFTSAELAISSGQWVSVADYCEVQLTAPSTGDWNGAYTVNGYAEAAGVLVAKDARVTAEGADRVAWAQTLRAELVADGPVRLEMRDNALCSAVAGGRDRAQEISGVTNPEYGLHLVELGLGSNPAVLGGTNWHRNSQMNEGTGTFHLGFGEGLTGAHMDFIIPRADIV